jgi:hypothetical protein
MNKRAMRIAISATAITLLLLAGALAYFGVGAGSGHANAKSLGAPSLNKIQKRLISGFLSSEFDSHLVNNTATKPGNYFPSSDDGCPQSRGNNIKVNQNCLNLSDVDLQGRGQANNETAIAQDPNNPAHIVASANDYRRGDGNCYGAFSLISGQNWADTTVPMGFTRGTAFGGVARQYWQAGGDTSVAWDTKGNAYMSCQMFMRGPNGVTNNPDQSSSVYVFRSTHNSGASWNFPGHPVVEAYVVNSPTGLPLEDKPYMTVDNHKGSPFQDRIYDTYTEFAADGTAYIYESYSNDYGQTFSPRVVVSTTSPLCTNTYGLPTPHGTCNENQFSQPFTGPDGALYVAYANYNNSLNGPNDNHNQMLIAKSTDGGQTFSAPVLVGNYYDLPDCATYQGGQDPFRACVPEKGNSQNSVFRAANYPSGAVNPLNPKQVVVTFGSYINPNSNVSNGCVPAGFSSTTGINLYTGVKTPGACNNDILVSVSKNGGTSFTGTTTDPRKLTSANPNSGATDQWWQWAAFSQSGKFATSYYDRKYSNDEFNGNMDVTLSGVDDPYTEFATARATSSSMPLPTQFPDAQGNSVFFGDYSGLSAADDVAHPVWMDTRSPDLLLCPSTGAPGVPPQVCTFTEPNGLKANDQEIYTAVMGIPHL